MNSKTQTKPDIAKTSVDHSTALDWVGMTDVELPVLVKKSSGIHNIPARCELFVSLDDAQAKGIHMSRLYLKAQEHFQEHSLNFKSLTELNDILVDSHADLSDSSKIKVSFEYMLKRKALKSSQEGWRFYPISFSSIKKAEAYDHIVSFEIDYSSTCPCSAALSRQLVQENFLNTFAGQNTFTKEEIYQWLAKEESQAAVPHAQRSIAKIDLKFSDTITNLDIEEWIDLLEATIQTPVQAAVKREDEQEFARLNAENLMFSEDAARKIKLVLNQREEILDYQIEIDHLESLHPHNASVRTRK